MHAFFRSPFSNFEFLRLIAMAPFEGGEIAENLEAVSKIKDLDPESWYDDLSEAGTKAEQIAREGEDSKDKVAARRGYLRAARYLQSAMSMLNDGPIGYDKRVLPTIERSIRDSPKGAQLLDGPEIYFINASVGQSLSYAVLTFDSPGQGIVLRCEKLAMRPDWEIVVGKVLDHLWDFAAQHRDANLDLDHVGITGATMGGYFALRGTVDPRIAACISINGYYSMESFTEGRVPGWLWKGFRAGYIPKSIFNAVVRVTSSLNFQPRWEFNHMKWALGQDNEYDMIRRMLDFSLRRHDGSEVLHDVKYPVLVTGAGFSFYFDPSTTTRSITDKLVHLTAEENGEWIARDVAFGGLQAKIGAFGYSMQRTFGWLDKVWQIERYSLRPMGEISSEGEGVNTNGVPDNVFILKKP